MGEAKKRRDAQATRSPLSDDDLFLLSRAIGQVVGAITNNHGADCLMYAGVGAKTLAALGQPAQMVIGSAAWRVGPGAGDVISHALEMLPQTSTLAKPGLGVAAGMFHAWIEISDSIVDFTTFSLPEKARKLDDLDGGKTQVDWSPAVLRTNRRQDSNFSDVVNGYCAGAFAYRRRHDIERTILEKYVRDFDYDTPASAVLMAFRALQAGSELRVVGVGKDGVQTLENVRDDTRLWKRVR